MESLSKARQASKVELTLKGKKVNQAESVLLSFTDSAHVEQFRAERPSTIFPDDPGADDMTTVKPLPLFPRVGSES